MIKRALGEEKGATAVIVAFILVVLLGFAALVVDVGVLFEQRRQLQNAVDGAALAGAQQIPIDVTQTKEMAYLYAEKNGVSRSEVIQNHFVSIFNGGDGIKVTARRKVDLFFAPVLGQNFRYVEAQATAILTQIQWQDIWPWGVTQESYWPGQEVTLKLGARNSVVGNFMALDFPNSSGGSAYRDYIQQGFCSSPYEGCPVPANISSANTWTVDTETGNLAGPTIQGISFLQGSPQNVPIPDLRNPLVGLVPLLTAETWAEVIGKSSVDVAGFAVFVLEDVDQAPGGLVEVHGRFVDWAYGVGRSQNIGGRLEGVIGARLWD